MPYQASESRYQTMRYRPAGRTGLKLPALSLGLWHNFGKYDSLDNMKSLLFTAFDHGICHFDLANNYGPDPGCAEENFGRIMQSDLRKYRDELVISTKAGCEMWEGPYGQLGSRKHLLASLDQSLKRMGLEYVDIFYLHCQDRETPLEESMLALDQAVRQGKALYAAISNHTGETAVMAVSILREKRTPFALLQNSYSMLNRRIEDNGLQQFAVESGSGIIAFKPLEQGILTGKYQQGIPADSRIRRDGRYLREDAITEKTLRQVSRLQVLAEQRGQMLAEMALAWVYAQPGIASVLIGASRAEQILQNLNMLRSAPFTAEELTLIDEIAADKEENP